MAQLNANSTVGGVQIASNNDILGIKNTATETVYYYVRTDGNDANTGLANTAGEAFRTIGKLISMIPSIFSRWYYCYIQTGDYTAEGVLTLRDKQGKGLTFYGNGGYVTIAGLICRNLQIYDFEIERFEGASGTAIELFDFDNVHGASYINHPRKAATGATHGMKFSDSDVWVETGTGDVFSGCTNILSAYTSFVFVDLHTDSFSTNSGRTILAGDGAIVKYYNKSLTPDKVFCSQDSIITHLGGKFGVTAPDGYTDPSYFTVSGSSITAFTPIDGYPKHVRIPPVIGGVIMTTLAIDSFSNKGIISVIIPETITTLGQGVFYNNSALKYVRFEGNGITTINSIYTFYACAALASIEIPSSLTTLSSDATVFSTGTVLVGPVGGLLQKYAITNSRTFQAAFSNPCQNLIAPPSDHLANGMMTNAYQAGATITAMQLVYMGSSSKWLVCDADAISTCGLVALSLEAKNDTQAMSVLLSGIVRDDSWTWTIGGAIYASGTAGALTQTQPVGVDGVIRFLGYALTATSIYFSPDMIWATHT